MEKSKSVATPVEARMKLVRTMDDDEFFDQEIYQSAVGCLLYLPTKARPDIAYTVGNFATFTAKPMTQHCSAVNGFMIYLNSTLNHGLLYGEGSSPTGCYDANWAVDLDDRKSTPGYVFTISGAAVSWMSKKKIV